MSTVSMSVSDWIKVRDNPIQRDTERHAAKAKHLLTPLPIHAITFAAKLPNGDLVKLDGHTRALLWKRNQVKHPPKVEVNVIQVDDLEGAKALYRTLDSKEALEGFADKVSGGYRLMKFEPKSGLLKSGNITVALRLAWRGLMGLGDHPGRNVDIYQAIEEFIPELSIIDSLELRQGDINGALLAAMMLTYRKYGDKVLAFWRAYAADAGTKMDGEMDAIQALRECVLSRKKLYGGSATEDMCGRGLRAVEKWLCDESLRAYPKPISISNYAERKPATFQLIKKSKAA